MRKKTMQQGTKNNNMLKMNSALLLRIIRERGICSRVELSKTTGLTQASITKIVASLIQKDIIRETGLLEGSERGRKCIGLRLNSETGKVVAIKLSRTFITIGVFDINGKLYVQSAIHFEENDKQELIFKKVTLLIDEYLIAFHDILAISAAVPGPFLKSEGRIALYTEFHGRNFIHLKELLENKYKMPTFLIHDANAGALAHWWFEKRSNNKHALAYLLLGEGVGGGFVVDGELVEGADGTAVEIGHMSININGEQCECGNRGCLECYCSTIALVKKAKEAIKTNKNSGLNQYHDLTYFDVFNEFEKQDELATNLIRSACEYIAYGVVNVIYLYNPDIIIIGDQMSRAGDFLLDIINQIVSKRVIPDLLKHLSIEISSSSVDPILYGAAAVATDYILNCSTSL